MEKKGKRIGMGGGRGKVEKRTESNIGRVLKETWKKGGGFSVRIRI